MGSRYTRPCVFSDIPILLTMAEKEDKIEMTTEEKERFSKAMEKPEFKKLFFDYMDEIQDPTNRALYDQELQKYEKQLKDEKSPKPAPEKTVPEEVQVQPPTAKSKSTVRGNRRALHRVMTHPSSAEDIF